MTALHSSTPQKINAIPGCHSRRRAAAGRQEKGLKKEQKKLLQKGRARLVASPVEAFC